MSYLASRSLVTLPLNSTNTFQIVEILICGGGPENAYCSKFCNFRYALNNYGRIFITDRNPRWLTEKTPKMKVMPDMLSLRNGEIMIINVAQKGGIVWELPIDHSYSPFLYR